MGANYIQTAILAGIEISKDRTFLSVFLVMLHGSFTVLPLHSLPCMCWENQRIVEAHEHKPAPSWLEERALAVPAWPWVKIWHSTAYKTLHTIVPCLTFNPSWPANQYSKKPDAPKHAKEKRGPIILQWNHELTISQKLCPRSHYVQ